MPPKSYRKTTSNKKYTKDDKIAYYKSLAAKAGNRMAKNYKKPYRFPGAGRAIGSAIGGYAGGAPGAILGGALGQGGHSLVKTITGFGDYKVSKNSMIYNRDSVPEFTNKNPRCTMITHREFITDVVGSSEFRLQQFRINPAIGETFPWLASIAQNYEQYVVQGMVFEFKTTSATAIGSSNTALGTVVMATQYNSLSPAFTSKQQMENYEFCQSTVPSQSILHAIECDPTQTQCGGIFNISNELVEQQGDLRLYDVGRFNIATVGMQSEAVIGELWVSYKICFLKPRLRVSSGGSDIYSQTVPGDVSVAKPVGPYESLSPYSTNSGTVIPISDTEFGIDTNFTGVIQCNIMYKAADLVTALVTPVFSVFGGAGSVDVTQSILRVPATDSFNVIDPLAGNAIAYSQAYFRIMGGLDSTTITPYIQLSGLSLSGSGGCDIVQVSFIAMPESIYSATI